MALVLLGCATPPPVPERLEFLNYQGQVNEHHTLIKASPSQVFAVLTDFDRFVRLIPTDRVELSKVTPGPYQVGTTIRAETVYKIKLGWHSKVVNLEKDRAAVPRRALPGWLRGVGIEAPGKLHQSEPYLCLQYFQFSLSIGMGVQAG
jgi:hypothetical protein